MEKVWLKHYAEGMAAEIDPEHFSSINALLDCACEKYADRPVFSNMGTRITYAEFAKRIREVAAFLQKDLKLQKGDRIAIMMPNLLQYPVMLFAALRLGLVVVNVNPLYTGRELAHQLNDSGAKAIVVLANFAEVLSHALPETHCKQVIVTELGDLFPPVKRAIVNFVVKTVKRMVPEWSIPGAISFRELLKKSRHYTLDEPEVHNSDLAFLQYTGGTTGVAKGAMLSHRNIVANTLQMTELLRILSKEGDDEIVITALPLYHIFALTVNMMTFLHIGGLNVLVTNPRDIKAFVKEMASVPFTCITAVNTLYNALISNSAFQELDFSKLKIAIGGGMAVQSSVAEKWQALTGRPILEGYGLTETSPLVTGPDFTADHFDGTVGRPIPSTDIIVIDEHNKELPIGETGELCVKGPQVMNGYWQRPKETDHVFTADGWLRTGDIAKVDELGRVHIMERKKDMIIVSGFNVYPNEVEGVLVQHPAVHEVAVVGVISTASGEAVKAFVVTNGEAIDAAELIAYCRKSLTAYKVPKIIEFRDDLPKSNVGKILRRELRD